MLKKWLMGLGVPALALAGVMLMVQPAAAQRFGGFGLGAGHGWGYAPGYGYNYGASPYFGSYSPYAYNSWNTGYNTSYYPGWNNWNTGWNNSYYYPNTYSYGNWSYPNTNSYYYGHQPTYYYSGVNTASNWNPNQTTSFYSADHMFHDQNVPQTAALIQVRVPPNAQIWFSDHKTNEQGHMRQFVTPALDKDGLFYYMLRARWNDGSRDVDRTQKVLVRAGDRINVDFNRDVVTVDEMTPYHFQGQSQSGYEGMGDQNNQFNRNDQFNPNNPERVPSTTQPNININNNNAVPQTTTPQNIPAPRNPTPGTNNNTTTPNGNTTTPSGSNTPTTNPGTNR